MGALWLAAGGFLAGWASATGDAGPLPAAGMLLLPVVAGVVWRTGVDHPAARRRLDVLVVAVCGLLWALVVAL